jgi:hypothetical protein
MIFFIKLVKLLEICENSYYLWIVMVYFNIYFYKIKITIFIIISVFLFPSLCMVALSWNDIKYAKRLDVCQ